MTTGAILFFRWELNVKTGSSEGVLLYSSAGGAHSDFVGVEIISGKIKIIFDKGGGPIEVRNDVLVSDGQWHKVIVNFNPTVAQVTVDHSTSSVKISHTTTRFFDLDDTVSIFLWITYCCNKFKSQILPTVIVLHCMLF